MKTRIKSFILVAVCINLYSCSNKENKSEPIQSESRTCGNETSARYAVNDYLRDKGFNHLDGEYEAKIIEIHKISDCSYLCKIQIKD